MLPVEYSLAIIKVASARAANWPEKNTPLAAVADADIPSGFPPPPP